MKPYLLSWTKILLFGRVDDLGILPCLVLFLGLISTTALSQVRAITGRVIDSDTKQPIVAAHLYLIGSGSKTTTDSVGFFQIDVNDSIDTGIVISHVSYFEGRHIGKETELTITARMRFERLVPFGFVLGKDSLVEQYNDSVAFTASGWAASSNRSDWEKNARYPGGWSKFIKYIGEKMPSKYTGAFRFIIDEHGRPTEVINIPPSYMPNHKMDKSDSMLAALISNMSVCEPATQDGIKVSQGFELNFDSDEIFTIVEQAGSPIGGIEKFYKWLDENLKYPLDARKRRVTGKVFVQFIIEKDGSLSNVKVIKGIGGGCDEEALRVVSSAPKWNPGKINGKPAREKYVLTVIFDGKGNANQYGHTSLRN